MLRIDWRQPPEQVNVLTGGGLIGCMPLKMLFYSNNDEPPILVCFEGHAPYKSPQNIHLLAWWIILDQYDASERGARRRASCEARGNHFCQQGPLLWRWLCVAVLLQGHIIQYCLFLHRVLAMGSEDFCCCQNALLCILLYVWYFVHRTVNLS